jgi:hypothetical protein
MTGTRFSIACVALLLGMVAAHAQGGDNSRAVKVIDGSEAPLVAAPPTAIDVRNMTIRSENSAGLDLAILPGAELETGAKVTLRVATKKQGYLILVDVDPSGKLTQIYPNRHSLQTKAAAESLNLMKPGQSVTIPDLNNPFAGFEFIASPPAGIAMVVAILSDRPVHLVDLPDVAPPQTGQAAFDQLFEVARQLRIVREDERAFQEPKWSFDAKLYLVR